MHFFDNNTLADIFRELNIENIFEGQKESELGKILFIDQEEWERELFKDENPEYSEGSKLLGHNVEQLINSINNQSSAEENMVFYINKLTIYYIFLVAHSFKI